MLLQVAHNDLKTKNVLLSKDGAVAKISDVGTSRILEHTCTTAGAAMECTFAYAAPEQLLGNRDACNEKVRLLLQLSLSLLGCCGLEMLAHVTDISSHCAGKQCCDK